MSHFRNCKDCLAEGLPLTRKAPNPGPRCVTHHRAVIKARRLAAQQKRVLDVYSITADEYDAIYEVQGGRCAICERATGARKRLAVDHDHSCCNGPTSCGRCVRGLACGQCNKILGHFRDSPEAFERGAEYLRNWPSRRANVGTAREPGSAPFVATAPISTATRTDPTTCA